MASASKHILRSSSNILFRKVYAKPALTRQDVQDNVKTLAFALESVDEGSLFPPVHGQDPTPATPRSILKLLGHTKLRSITRQLVQKKAERIFNSRLPKTEPKAADAAFSNTFHIGFEFANEGWRTAPFYLLECVLTQTALNGALNKVFV